MKIFFSVGEPSGDLHGANLIAALRRLRPDILAVGYGGPRMAAAGCQLHTDLTELAIMWFFRVLWHLRTFWRLLRDADWYFERHRPDAVVLIDYPGFNWWIARKAKARGIPVFYYGVPQMWAWAPWRVSKMRRLVDHVLCKLPFEARWYQQHDCNATYVGHPYFDELHSRRLDQDFLQQFAQRPGRLVTILPGSRTQEVHNNLTWFLKAARRIHQDVSDVRFAVACFNDRHRQLVQQALRETDLPVEVFSGRTAELIHLAHCCMACSGSVSLELLYHLKPGVVLYWVPRWLFWFGSKFLAKVKYITLVNLLADDNPFAHRPRPFDPDAPNADDVPYPEYPTCEDKSRQLARHVVHWLQDDASYQRRLNQLAQLRTRFCTTGASQAAAAYILEHLPPATRPGQHEHAA
jgi:lipid-A-disaccharide synthase